MSLAALWLHGLREGDRYQNLFLFACLVCCGLTALLGGESPAIPGELHSFLFGGHVYDEHSMSLSGGETV